jgi:hypothetical protein
MQMLLEGKNAVIYGGGSAIDVARIITATSINTTAGRVADQCRIGQRRTA